MTIGILYIAFGENCDYVAAHCVAYSRKYTKLPITVLTNLTARNPRWNSIEDVTFRYFALQTSDNRLLKTSMVVYSPYDFTIYLDADSIIQNEGFDEKMYELIGNSPNLILNHFCEYPYQDGRFQNIYLRALRKFNCDMPLDIYNGAFIGFSKETIVFDFFNLWKELWLQFGAQREMPPLACAINLMKGLKIERLPQNFFSPDSKNDDSVVQHNYHQDFWKRIGCKPKELFQAKYEVGDYGFTKI